MKSAARLTGACGIVVPIVGAAKMAAPLEKCCNSMVLRELKLLTLTFDGQLVLQDDYVRTLRILFSMT